MRPASIWRHAAGLLAVLLVALTVAGAGAADDLAEAQRQGVSLLRAGRHGEAVAELQKALDLAEARYGIDSPAAAGDISNLAEANRIAGRLDAAEALFRRAIAIDGRKGGDPIGLATSLNNLALVQRARGQTDEAEKLYLQALPLLEQELGVSHPDIAKALNNLAVLYRVRGEPAKARPLQERAVAIAERSLGARHATTSALRDNLALLDGGVAPLEPAAGPTARDRRAGGPATPPLFRPRPALTAKVATPAMATAAAASRQAPKPEPAAARAAAGGPAVVATASGGPAVVATASGGTPLLHMGSIKDGAAVDSEWARLVRRHPQLAALARAPAQRVEVDGKGVFWRVLARAPTGSDAAAICAALRAAGDACRVLGR